MSAPVGASSLLGDTHQPGVANTGTGEPAFSVADAWGRRAELMRDPDFKARLDRAEPAARGEMARVVEGITAGVTIIPGRGVDPAKFGPQVAEAAQQRQALECERTLDALRRDADIPENVADMIRTGASVTRQERHLAEMEKQRLFKDSAWVQKYMAGDCAARSRMALVNVILSRAVSD
jgi:hypothetical protein